LKTHDKWIQKTKSKTICPFFSYENFYFFFVQEKKSVINCVRSILYLYIHGLPLFFLQNIKPRKYFLRSSGSLTVHTPQSKFFSVNKKNYLVFLKIFFFKLTNTFFAWLAIRYIFWTFYLETFTIYILAYVLVQKYL